MSVENTIQFGQSVSAQAAREAARPASGSDAAARTSVGPILPQPSVRVSVTGSALDKLVAKVKGESEDARLNTAKVRISVVLATLSALNIQITEKQRTSFARLEVLGHGSDFVIDDDRTCRELDFLSEQFLEPSGYRNQ